ncbi:MAG: SMI1/KNR4 family protein [Polyangiaceae bacterium]|nr:SMI1/KNR4 family protein [Polyangiaceae bacterium]
MTFADLTKKLAPPPGVEPVSEERWSHVEAMLGHALPGDYKEFINVYGAGSLGDCLWVLSPFSKDPSGLLIRENLARMDQLALYGRQGVSMRIKTADPTITRALAAHDERSKELSTLPPWPDKWLVWGVLKNGGALYFLRSGAAVRWQSVHVEPPSAEGLLPLPVQLKGNMTAVVAGLLSGQTTLSTQGGTALKGCSQYIPISEKTAPAYSVTGTAAVSSNLETVQLKRPRK